jgi:hypothetical protein
VSLWLQTIGGAVDEGHWRRSGQYRRSVRCHGRQCGCCTFVLHPQGKTLTFNTATAFRWVHNLGAGNSRGGLGTGVAAASVTRTRSSRDRGRTAGPGRPAGGGSPAPCSRSCPGRWCRPLFFGLGPASREPGQGEHGQRDVGVPGPPGTDLVVIQPGLALGLLDALLSRPLLIPVKKKSSLAFRVHPGRY